MVYLKQDTDKICYMILPEGIRGDLSDGLKTLSEQHAVSIVVIDGANWNDDLTPWPAVGVFKKAKPFGGKAASFLKRLTDTVIPEAETHLGIKDAERTLLGVSLSGLFAIWSAFNTDAFTNLISLSGSLWYDGFTDWMKGQTPSPQLKQVCMLLGEKEKNAKEQRMASVEEQTMAAADLLKTGSQATVTFERVEGTHFSPIMPRLERAFDIVYGTTTNTYQYEKSN
ncbi:MAG: alpha/beta hydrolase [Bacteroidales bacterium]|nr:alpha/beta hydrolase [Bacteroidales bacterium]